MRGDKIYKGKEAIAQYFSKQTLQNVKLKWVPDHIEVSSSGDMAYTYGKYTFNAENDKGEGIHAEGIFHTVWQRQSDGEWKFVYD